MKIFKIFFQKCDLWHLKPCYQFLFECIYAHASLQSPINSRRWLFLLKKPVFRSSNENFWKFSKNLCVSFFVYIFATITTYCNGHTRLGTLIAKIMHFVYIVLWLYGEHVKSTFTISNSLRRARWEIPLFYFQLILRTLSGKYHGLIFRTRKNRGSKSK